MLSGLLIARLVVYFFPSLLHRLHFSTRQLPLVSPTHIIIYLILMIAPPFGGLLLPRPRSRASAL